MLTQNLDHLRTGGQIQPKKASENYWAGKIARDELNEAARKICEENWQTQLAATYHVSQVPMQNMVAAAKEAREKIGVVGAV